MEVIPYRNLHNNCRLLSFLTCPPTVAVTPEVTAVLLGFVSIVVPLAPIFAFVTVPVPVTAIGALMFNVLTVVSFEIFTVAPVASLLTSTVSTAVAFKSIFADALSTVTLSILPVPEIAKSLFAAIVFNSDPSATFTFDDFVTFTLSNVPTRLTYLYLKVLL